MRGRISSAILRCAGGEAWEIPASPGLVIPRVQVLSTPIMSPISDIKEPYGEFQAELREIERHKWIVSELEGRDVGFERALTEWSLKHRSQWRRERREALEGISRAKE